MYDPDSQPDPPDYVIRVLIFLLVMVIVFGAFGRRWFF